MKAKKSVTRKSKEKPEPMFQMPTHTWIERQQKEASMSYPNNLDITPIFTPKDPTKRLNTEKDDPEENFVEFLKNVQLYL